MSNQSIEIATLGAGCFWCVEAIFQQMKGVTGAVSGYIGGSVKNPTYKEVCGGKTGHAEVLQITYDATKVSFEELLHVFWHTHNPTTLNRQGADVGTQYRSAIFYHNEAQKNIAEQSKATADNSDLWTDPIVTEIVAATVFYPAEGYHQNYFNLHGHQPYCANVINPKVQKFRKAFAEKLKES